MQDPLIVIVGPTASGKTALGIELAKQFNGEIICADSRTVYKGLDIGTAKPSKEEQAQVPHHLLDEASPDESFTVADFKEKANGLIRDISVRGKLPIMVGGSGLYIDAVIYDYSFSGDTSQRDSVNPRHVKKELSGSKGPLRDNTLVIGLAIDKEVLKERIKARADTMIADGLVQEVRTASRAYPYSKALDAPGYKEFSEYLEGSLSLQEAKEVFVQNHIKLAKRQMTWFKRNKSIQWLNKTKEAAKLVESFLNK